MHHASQRCLHRFEERDRGGTFAAYVFAYEDIMHYWHELDVRSFRGDESSYRIPDFGSYILMANQ